MKLGKSVILALSSSMVLGLIFGCGGGSSSDVASVSDNVEYINVTEELNGTISVNYDTGVSIYESEEIEIKPGLLFKRSAVLTPKDPQNDQLGYSAMSILKFTNTTDSEETTKFIENLPKSFATHVDQLEYKVLKNQPPNLTITDLLNDSSNFVSIDDVVNEGYVEVIEEDPIYAIAVIGSISIPSLYVLKYHPDLIGLTAISTVEQIDKKDDEEKKEWVDDSLLTENCSAIRHSAEANNIPAKLLANIVLNEMADNDWKDSLQEVIYTGANRSHGWPQLQPQRVLDHALIDIGSVDEVRDPTVDVVKDDLIAYEGPDAEGVPITIYTPVARKVFERLVTPEPSLELAAREIAYLLDMFKKGSSVLNNPWAKSLLKNPEEGIDRNNIYDNLKVPPGTSDDPGERQIALDGTLALLVAAGYNGSGNIFNRTKDEEVFTPLELLFIQASGYDGLLEHNIPWESVGSIDLYSFAAPRIHGENAAKYFPKVLHESECLEETVDETILWTTYPNAEFCSMKEEANELMNEFTINSWIEIPYVIYLSCGYYPTGEIRAEAIFRNGVLDGYKKYYDEEGNVSWDLYEDGQFITTSQ